MLYVLVVFLFGCASSPQQQQLAEQHRLYEREQRDKREMDERQRRHAEESERERKKYAHLSTDEIRIKIASLSQEISQGYFGTGLGLLIAKGIYDGKVKEREVLTVELMRRGEPMPTTASAAPRNIPNVRGRQIVATGALYIGVGDGHWIESVMDGGKLIRLEDRSLWQVSPLDVIESSLWLPISDITVIEGDDPSYPFKLINTDDREVVNAKLLSH